MFKRLFRGSAIAGVAIILFASTGCSAMGPMMASQSAPPFVPGVLVSEITRASRSVTRSVHLDAPREQVFATLTDFESMPDWMPGLSSMTANHSYSSTPGQCGVGTQRTCKAPGMTLREEIVHYEYPTSYAYRMTSSEGAAVPLREGVGIVHLEDSPSGGTNLTYHVLYETKTLHPMGAVFPTMLKRQLGDGLENLAGRFGGSVTK